jgi:nucleoid DNA-binding protein
MRQIDIEDLFKNIAVKHGVPKYQVEMVYRSMFEMVYQTMKAGKMENILLHRFGKFVVPKGKLFRKDPDLYEQIYGDSDGLEEPVDQG